MGEAPKSYDKEDPERRRKKVGGGQISGHEEIGKDARRGTKVHNDREIPRVKRWVGTGGMRRWEAVTRLLRN